MSAKHDSASSSRLVNGISSQVNLTSDGADFLNWGDCKFRIEFGPAHQQVCDPVPSMRNIPWLRENPKRCYLYRYSFRNLSWSYSHAKRAIVIRLNTFRSNRRMLTTGNAVYFLRSQSKSSPLWRIESSKHGHAWSVDSSLWLSWRRRRAVNDDLDDLQCLHNTYHTDNYLLIQKPEYLTWTQYTAFATCKYRLSRRRGRKHASIARSSLVSIHGDLAFGSKRRP
jgi:hypothetical protein